MMDLKPLSFHYEDAVLYVVPAIHFNHVFAWEVNKICFDGETRPDAIAVELGPHVAKAAVNWLDELSRTDNHKNLPVMLGLLKRNRLIHTSFKQKAIQLQKETGKDLSELHPDILQKELGFYGYSLLCLSPTDSIIEALRCGIALNVPVFGVDLDEMASGINKPVVLVQSPAEVNDIPAYVGQNAHFAELGRDEEVDLRRETVMAARLKVLLTHYRKVVFTCGMAHWLRIRDLLKNDTVSPALMPEITEKILEEYKRVVVHPLIAARYMDLFPAMAKYYEAFRVSSNGHANTPNKRSRIDAAKIFHVSLKKAYRDYFKGKGRACGEDLERFCDFEGYLGNLCMLNQRPIPDLGMTIRAAKETMSADFVRALTDMFMKFPWASPDKFPGSTLIGPSSNNGNDAGSVILVENGHQGEKGFYIRPVLPNTFSLPPDIPYKWRKSKKLIKVFSLDFSVHTWLPWDRLISSMSLRAIKAASKKHAMRKPEAFEGSILEGIDVKATIRAYSRGDERFYVRNVSEENRDGLNLIEGFPVVWILQPGNNNSSEWIVLHEPCSYMERYVRDKTSFRHIANRRGHNMVATIAYGSRNQKNNGSSLSEDVKCDLYHGVILFQPICWTNKQFAHWAELTRYSHNPFCSDSFLGNGAFNDLFSYYIKKHGIKLGEFHWATTLILLALPFAKEVLTVVVPEGYHIDRVVYRMAKKHRIDICPVSHNLFSQAELDRLSLCQLVPVITHEPTCVYSKNIEKCIGERQTDNLHLVPQTLLDFGEEA